MQLSITKYCFSLYQKKKKKNTAFPLLFLVVKKDNIIIHESTKPKNIKTFSKNGFKSLTLNPSHKPSLKVTQRKSKLAMNWEFNQIPQTKKKNPEGHAKHDFLSPTIETLKA